MSGFYSELPSTYGSAATQAERVMAAHAHEDLIRWRAENAAANISAIQPVAGAVEAVPQIPEQRGQTAVNGVVMVESRQ